MMARGVEQMREAVAREGRDPRRLEVSALLIARGRSFEDALDEDVPNFERVGVTHLRVQMSMFVASIDEIEPFIRRLMLRPWTLD